MLHARLLVPDPSHHEYRAAAAELAAGYAALFARHGVAVRAVPWTEAAADVPAIALLCWGYHLLPDAWRALLAGWPEDVPLVNPARVLGWNTDKRYLRDLEAAGVPVVPTRFVDRANDAALAAAREAFGTRELVVKPRVSGGAYRTERVGGDVPAPGTRDAMVQPFLPAVSGEGELSLFFFGGRSGHAVRKVAAAGDFRVQREHGGIYTVVDRPDPALSAIAAAAVAAVPTPPAYARVDLIRLADGRAAVMELELIEPDLYLDLVPKAGDAFGEAVAAALRP